MKLHFDNVMFNNVSAGPHCFARRLAAALFEAGHEVVMSGPEADVSLVFIERTGMPLAKKFVQRLDGFWFKPEEYKTKNRQIMNTYACADAVVFQSHYTKKFVTKFWGDIKVNAVIGNGVDIRPVTEFSNAALKKLRDVYENVFVCSANWHAQKRLRANTELYMQLRGSMQSSCLLVLGSNPDYVVRDRDVYYTGSVPEEVYMQAYSMADWMIHLSWCENCPNTVIECLSQNTPVICAEDGGTKELVDRFGVVLREGKPFEYVLADYDNPPYINVNQLSSLPDKSSLGPHGDIDIKSIVKKYIEVFEHVVAM